jgi:hypothetical protein
MSEPRSDSIEVQTQLALAALAVSFAKTLQECGPHEPVLVTLQRKVQGEQTRLRQTPDAEVATAMFRFVIKSLRDPGIIEQPNDC